MVHHGGGAAAPGGCIFPTASISGGRRHASAALARTLQGRGWLSRSYPARGRDLWTGEEIPVLALEARAYGLLFRLRHWLGTLPAEVQCYNCDLDVASYYLYARRLYPCAWYHLEAGEGGGSGGSTPWRRPLPWSSPRRPSSPP